MPPDHTAPASSAEGERRNPFAVLPSVTALVAAARDAGSSLAEPTLTAAVQHALAIERAAIAVGQHPMRADVSTRTLAAVLNLEHLRLSPLLNATGVVIHTNLGRAPVSDETAEAMARAAANPVPLELEPETNERGGRGRDIAALMQALTGAEATLVVNNCAAAVLLTLSTLAAGRGVIVSRGEAVEIGGGFRIPDVLRQSGATLVEVGTTNRTYAHDYAEATDERTAAYLKAHPSNFRMVGFTHVPTLAELVDLAHARGVLLLEDLGSGALFDTRPFGLAPEPTLPESIAAGVDVATISGDKLLGGPQAGIIAGRAEWVARIARHPLARAVRADKTSLAGLAVTLRHYARGEAVEKIPIWRAIAARPEDLRGRVEQIVADLIAAGINAHSVAAASTIGGGSLPGETLPSWAIAVDAEAIPGRNLEATARRLRLGTPGVYGRIERDRLLFDLRTVLPEDDERLGAALRGAVGLTG